MKKFLDKDFLLKTETARRLYHDYAENMPIIDYHCHVSPREIYEDVRFENIADLWLGGDHYKWRIMRSNGVDEEYITGSASPREKFQKFCEAMPFAIGNPMHHWCHLELKNYFGYEGIISGDTAEEIWQLTSEKLREKNMSVRGLIKQSNVEFIGTTDDPIDSLEWHDKLKQDNSFDVTVAPSFRPDKALNIDKACFAEYINSLGKVSGVNINDIESLKSALKNRLDHFEAHGCRASDHGLDRVVYEILPEEELNRVLKKVLNGGVADTREADAFKTELLIFCAAEYKARGWIMQLHFNCLRNPNEVMFSKLGADSGFDCIGPCGSTETLPCLLNRFNRNGNLPKTILYSLDPSDNAFLGSLIGSFQSGGLPGKLQHGSAWWFNDNKIGMEQQMISLANLSLLGNFIGMLTDSRSFLSYSRHEYFRRILCNLIGDWVENGEYPADEKSLKEIVQNVSYYNAVRYLEEA